VVADRVTAVADLVASLPGFTERHVDANSVQLHFVEGGTGAPLLLLPG
jgi:hypothetical protein